MGEALVPWTDWQLVDSDSLLDARVLSHGVDLVFVGAFLLVRYGAELFLLSSLVYRVESLAHSWLTCLAGVHMTRVGLFEVACAHFNLSLLRWMRIGLSYRHIDLIIIFLARSIMLGVRDVAPGWRFQVAIVQVSAIQASFRPRPIRRIPTALMSL